jgi:hypothetical protein
VRAGVVACLLVASCGPSLPPPPMADVTRDVVVGVLDIDPAPLPSGNLPVVDDRPTPTTTLHSATTTTTTLPHRPRHPIPPAPDPDPVFTRCPQWEPLAREVGWPESELERLDHVLFRESRCDPTQWNPEDPMGGSHGLTQVNGFWCRPTEYWPDGWLQAQEQVDQCVDLYDPEINLSAALAVWHNSGWSPWGL